MISRILFSRLERPASDQRLASSLQSKLARLWPCHLLASLVSLARLLRQPCHEPGKLQSKLARLRPCHLLASLVALARLLRQPCSRPSLKDRVLRLLAEATQSSQLSDPRTGGDISRGSRGLSFIPGQSCKEEGFLDFLSVLHRPRIP